MRKKQLFFFGETIHPFLQICLVIYHLIQKNKKKIVFTLIMALQIHYTEQRSIIKAIERVYKAQKLLTKKLNKNTNKQIIKSFLQSSNTVSIFLSISL